MQTVTDTTFQLIYSFDSDRTDHINHDGCGQHDETLTFDHEPGEAEFFHEALSRLDPNQLRALRKISVCQTLGDDGEKLPWLDDGKYYFSTI